jgi:2-succinyl-6-hydroxy-2,4-cyclohexadiene-1-carboxylate synthase
MPALLIAGALDHKFAQIAARMHEAIPRSWLDIVPQAGHAVHLEQPALYVHRVSQFLEQPALRAMPSQRSNRV